MSYLAGCAVALLTVGGAVVHNINNFIRLAIESNSSQKNGLLLYNLILPVFEPLKMIFLFEVVPSSKRVSVHTSTRMVLPVSLSNMQAN